MLSRVSLFVTLWTIARQLLCPWNFPDKNPSGLPFPTPGHLPDPGSIPTPLAGPASQAGSLPLGPPPGKPSPLNKINQLFLWRESK